MVTSTQSALESYLKPDRHSTFHCKHKYWARGKQRIPDSLCPFRKFPEEACLGELECQLRARPNRPTSVHDLTNALVAEWKQVPVAMFQHLLESLSRRVEAVTSAKGGQTPY
jgi:hypothetical protein